MFNLAWAYLNVGRRQESLALFEETHRLMRAKLGPDHPLTLNCLRDMSLAYTNLDRRAEAVLMREEALRLTKARLGPSHPSTLVATFWLAMAYLQADRVNDAIQLCAENLKLDRAVLGADHPETLRTLHLLAMALRRTDRFAEALPLEEEAWRLSKAKSGADHYDTLWYQSGLAHSYLLAKQPEKALPLYQEYLIRESIRLKADEPGLAAAQSNVGRVLLKFEQFTEAEKVLRACLALCQKLQPDVWTTFDTQTLLGGSLLGQKKYAEAEPLLVQGYEGMKAREAKIPLASKNYLAEAVERLVRLYEATGRPEKAQEWRAKLPPAGPGGPPPS
jgi:tetratricopeptide (TPR) repeat protein